MKYVVKLEKTDEGYAVCCPGLPGCWSQGETEEEALENIKDAIETYLATLEELTQGQVTRLSVSTLSQLSSTARSMACAPSSLMVPAKRRSCLPEGPLRCESAGAFTNSNTLCSGQGQVHPVDARFAALWLNSS